LLLLLAGAGRAELPSDLVGVCGPPKQAWQVTGLPAAATVIGFDDEHGPELLAAGARGGDQAPRLGDLTILSADGWVRRRIVLPAALVGRPVMLRRLVAAAGRDGAVSVFTLTREGAESSPRRLDLGSEPLTGPVIVGRTLLAAAARRLIAVDDLFEQRWSIELPELAVVPLASDGQRAFVAGPRTLTAVDLADGHKRWTVPLAAAPQTGLLVTAGQVVLGGADGRLRAFDQDNGRPTWQQLVSPAPFAPDLALAGPWIVTATLDGRLSGFDNFSGAPTWQAQRPRPIGSPVVGFGQCFVIGGGKLYAVPFDPKSAGWVYSAATPEGIALMLKGTPCLRGTRLYVGTIVDRLLALDLPDASGSIAWALPGGTAQRNGWVSPED
jgi:outer membrane protein assembly factor BamB